MPDAQSIIIEAARCFDGVELLAEPVDLLVTGGRIEWVGSGSAPQDVRRIRAGNRLLMPGLIDCHVHLEGAVAPDRLSYAARNARVTLESELGEGATSLIELKARLRAGTGLCQGRICGPTLVELVAQGTGQPAEQVRPFSPRPPVKPIPMAALLDREEAVQ